MNILNDFEFYATVLSHFKLLLRLSMIQGVLQCNERFILSTHSYAKTEVILLYLWLNFHFIALHKQGLKQE
jgi:hypothetical protein